MQVKKREPVRFTMYLPVAENEKIEFIRFKERLNKNTIILEALKEYLPRKLKNYPDYKEAKSE